MAPVRLAITGQPTPGRAVNQNEPAATLAGRLARLFADERDQLARIALAGPQAGVDQRAEPSVRDKPLAAVGRSQFDGVLGAEVGAHPAAFAGGRVHAKRARHAAVAGPVEENGVEPAQFLALAAGGAVAGLDATRAGRR